jgi:hypothetical protein
MQGRYRSIEDDRLVEENATMATAISIDTARISSQTYRYQLKLANLHNKQGKTHSVKDPMRGSKTRVTNTQWGLVFNLDEDYNYCAVVLSCDNSAPFDDITDRRSMQVSIVQNINGTVTQLAQTNLTAGVSLEDDMNTLAVDVDERGVTVSIGKNELEQVLEANIARPTGMVQVGYLVGPGARVAIERAVLTIGNEKQAEATATWTLEELDRYLENSSDSIEGYWKYLDRDMEDKWLRLGGRYTLAVVQAGDGYDLIYVSGAQVMKQQWQPGMAKGHISKTAFTGNYDLVWTDATMEALGEDAYATVENGVILTLNFPVYKSQVRFAKVMNLDD